MYNLTNKWDNITVINIGQFVNISIQRDINRNITKV